MDFHCLNQTISTEKIKLKNWHYENFFFFKITNTYKYIFLMTVSVKKITLFLFSVRTIPVTHFLLSQEMPQNFTYSYNASKKIGREIYK